MVNIRLKILEKGHIVQEQLIRVLQKHEDALSNASGSEYDDTEVKADISALEERVQALEDAQTPADP